MNWEDASEKILVTILSQLGFSIEVEMVKGDDGLCLQIQSEHEKAIIGRNGDRLEDLQYLVNRVLNKHFPDAPRVKVDCAHYREKQEKELVEKALILAGKVKAEGKPVRTRPLNAYYRRIVHNALMDVAGVCTASPKGESRYKRIEIKPA